MYESKNVYISPSEKRRQSTRDLYQMEFAKDLFSMLYPLKTVKRFIYRPMLGRWYPHIDVDLLGYDMQLGFFFDEVGVSFSKERFCCKCGAKLSEERPLNSYIPISLCSDCNVKIFYEYWDCLNSLYCSNSLMNDHFSNKDDNNKDDNTHKNVQKSACDDFLKPRCGYPFDGEYVNPCLKNHGIGLILVNTSELNYQFTSETIEIISLTEFFSYVNILNYDIIQFIKKGIGVLPIIRRLPRI